MIKIPHIATMPKKTRIDTISPPLSYPGSGIHYKENRHGRQGKMGIRLCFQRIINGEKPDPILSTYL
jgi:hypothetical protein